MVGDYGMERYEETFVETHLWDTNWKVLAENFMESYHLPVCHRGTIGGLSRLDEMVCPPGLPAFNHHTILKDDRLPIALAHPDNTRMAGDRRRTTYLLAIYPSLMITLTPGYFWYLSLHPDGVGRVRILFGGGMAPEYVNGPGRAAPLRRPQDPAGRGQRRGPRLHREGLPGPALRRLAAPGPLSHLERPNYDFARYLASRVAG